jgi:hypothetical protein
LIGLVIVLWMRELVKMALARVSGFFRWGETTSISSREAVALQSVSVAPPSSVVVPLGPQPLSRFDINVTTVTPPVGEYSRPVDLAVAGSVTSGVMRDYSGVSLIGRRVSAASKPLTVADLNMFSLLADVGSIDERDDSSITFGDVEYLKEGKGDIASAKFIGVGLSHPNRILPMEVVKEFMRSSGYVDDENVVVLVEGYRIREHVPVLSDLGVPSFGWDAGAFPEASRERSSLMKICRDRNSEGEALDEIEECGLYFEKAFPERDIAAFDLIQEHIKSGKRVVYFGGAAHLKSVFSEEFRKKIDAMSDSLIFLQKGALPVECEEGFLVHGKACEGY